MQIFIENTKKNLTVEHQGSARSLLEKIDVNPETVLIVKDGILVSEEEDIGDAEKIELLSVISGG